MHGCVRKKCQLFQGILESSIAELLLNINRAHTVSSHLQEMLAVSWYMVGRLLFA